MKQKDLISLGLIALLLALAIVIVVPSTAARIQDLGIDRDLEEFVLGLDLRGGVQALLEVPESYQGTIDPESLANAQRILENRTNALGVSENLFQVAGDRRIVAEFPGLTDPEGVLSVIKETGQMEFVDLGDNPEMLREGDIVRTDRSATEVEDPATSETAPTARVSEQVYRTVMTGDQLSSVTVGQDTLGRFVIDFALKPEGATIFGNHTTMNIGKILAIVLDNRIISAPRIDGAITGGQGQISGSFTNETANELAIQMRYGALPVPFVVVESRLIGPTLGQDSLQKSLVAGLIGFAIVILFMGIYYRVPGIVAILSILSYAVLTLALFKLIPVTLTLPGIAGFLLSTGSALDANILIFERLKEELRAGRSFAIAVDQAWKRAWPSIRDSNIATLITSGILFWFGSSFGATIVKGFAFTLGVGVFVSLFCAIVVTRTFLNLVIAAMKPETGPQSKHLKWFGITE